MHAFALLSLLQSVPAAGVGPTLEGAAGAGEGAQGAFAELLAGLLAMAGQVQPAAVATPGAPAPEGDALATTPGLPSTSTPAAPALPPGTTLALATAELAALGAEATTPAAPRSGETPVEVVTAAPAGPATPSAPAGASSASEAAPTATAPHASGHGEKTGHVDLPAPAASAHEASTERKTEKNHPAATPATPSAQASPTALTTPSRTRPPSAAAQEAAQAPAAAAVPAQASATAGASPGPPGPAVAAAEQTSVAPAPPAQAAGAARPAQPASPASAAADAASTAAARVEVNSAPTTTALEQAQPAAPAIDAAVQTQMLQQEPELQAPPTLAVVTPLAADAEEQAPAAKPAAVAAEPETESNPLSAPEKRDAPVASSSQTAGRERSGGDERQGRSDAAATSQPAVPEADAATADVAFEPLTTPAGRSETASEIRSAPLGRATPETVASLAAQMARRIEGRNTRFDIALDPAGLGSVQVSVEINPRGELSAHLTFERGDSAAELKARAAELQRALEQAGFDLSKGGLSFEHGPSGRGQERSAEHRHHGHARAFAQALETADSADTLPAGPVRLSRARSGVDLTV